MEFNLRILTPMILAGNDLSRAELRPPSFKGGIRFWWRAMQDEMSLKKLKEEEGKIFGDTKQKSRLSLRLSYDMQAFRKLERPQEEKARKVVFPPNRGRQRGNFNVQAENTKELVDLFPKNARQNIGYITYGTEKRKYIMPSDDFDIRLILKGAVSENEDIYDALNFMALFGGLGSKARNGLGSFKLLNNKPFDYITKLRQHMQKSPKSYTAFSYKMQLFETREYQSWQEALSVLAKIYQSSKKDQQFPKRQRKYIGYTGKGIPEVLRHAKSHFFNVVQNENGNYKGLVLHLPYQYLDNLGLERLDEVEEQRAYSYAQLAFNELLANHSDLNRIPL